MGGSVAESIGQDPEGCAGKGSETAGRRVAEESRAGICGVAGIVGAARVGEKFGLAAAPGNSANDERRVELLRDSRVGRKKIRGRMNIRWAQGRKTLGEWSAGIATGSTKKGR